MKMIKRQTKLSDSIELEGISNCVDRLVTDMTILLAKKTDDAIEAVLRTKVAPPIKGEITKGKIRWRGLNLVHDHWNGATHIMQRGKLIATVKTSYHDTIKY